MQGPGELARMLSLRRNVRPTNYEKSALSGERSADRPPDRSGSTLDPRRSAMLRFASAIIGSHGGGMGQAILIPPRASLCCGDVVR